MKHTQTHTQAHTTQANDSKALHAILMQAKAEAEAMQAKAEQAQARAAKAQAKAAGASAEQAEAMQAKAAEAARRADKAQAKAEQAAQAAAEALQAWQAAQAAEAAERAAERKAEAKAQAAAWKTINAERAKAEAKAQKRAEAKAAKAQAAAEAAKAYNAEAIKAERKAAKAMAKGRGLRKAKAHIVNQGKAHRQAMQAVAQAYCRLDTFTPVTAAAVITKQLAKVAYGTGTSTSAEPALRALWQAAKAMRPHAVEQARQRQAEAEAIYTAYRQSMPQDVAAEIAEAQAAGRTMSAEAQAWHNTAAGMRRACAEAEAAYNAAVTALYTAACMDTNGALQAVFSAAVAEAVAQFGAEDVLSYVALYGGTREQVAEAAKARKAARAAGQKVAGDTSKKAQILKAANSALYAERKDKRHAVACVELLQRAEAAEIAKAEAEAKAAQVRVSFDTEAIYVPASLCIDSVIELVDYKAKIQAISKAIGKQAARWLRMRLQGMRGAEIAKALGVTEQACTQYRKKAAEAYVRLFGIEAVQAGAEQAAQSAGLPQAERKRMQRIADKAKAEAERRQAMREAYKAAKAEAQAKAKAAEAEAQAKAKAEAQAKAKAEAKARKAEYAKAKAQAKAEAQAK